MIERVQVKVFFCFPASKVPTFVGSPDCRESRLTPEVPTAGSPGVHREFRRRSDSAVSFFNRPGPFFYCGYFFLLSSCRAAAALSAPRAAPSRPAVTAGLPRRGPCRLPRLPPPRPCSSAQAFIFPLDHGALAIGVEENPLVVEIVPVDLFVDDCVSFFLHPFPRFKVLPWCLNPNFNVPCVLTPFFLFLSSSISLVCVCVVI